VNVNVTVNSTSLVPTTISASPAVLCSGNPSTLGFTGGSLGTSASWHWYSGSCGGTVEGVGNSLVVSPSVTTSYYIRAEGMCNTTSCLTINITVYAVPTDPTSVTATPDTIYTTGGSTNLQLTGSLISGASWNWYENGCGTGSAVGVGASVTVTPAGTTTYYVRGENGICYSNCLTITVYVPGSLAAPTSVTANPNPVCSGQSSTLGLTGTFCFSSALWKATR